MPGNRLFNTVLNPAEHFYALEDKKSALSSYEEGALFFM
jgi:hypothetical protein